jgi:hypothetical protein
MLLVFPSLMEALVELVVGRDIEYTATFGLVLAAVVLFRQKMLPGSPPAQAAGP